MRYCEQCKIVILDDSEYCPLCHNVLSEKNEGTLFPEKIDYFPDIMAKKRRGALAKSILWFITVAFLAAAFLINNLQHIPALYLYIVTAGLIYASLAMEIVLRDVNYLKKVFLFTFNAVILVLIIDFYTGFHRWSVNFVLPGALCAIDIGLIILMIINSRNWQGYMMSQLLVIILGIIPLILIKLGIVTFPLVSETAFIASLLVFIGTLLIGGRTAREELKRRFHI